VCLSAVEICAQGGAPIFVSTGTAEDFHSRNPSTGIATLLIAKQVASGLPAKPQTRSKYVVFDRTTDSAAPSRMESNL
jgi:hypothetical protein